MKLRSKEQNHLEMLSSVESFFITVFSLFMLESMASHLWLFHFKLFSVWIFHFASTEDECNLKISLLIKNLFIGVGN